jgi:hypothetical protein
MLSLFKKTVLSVAMLGCAFGMQAEEKKTNASTLKTAIASAAIVAGGSLFSLSKYLNKVSLDGSNPYLGAGIGCTLAGLSALYLLSSAKGTRAKLYSLCGSLNLFAAGCAVHVGYHGLRVLLSGEISLYTTYNPLMVVARLVSGYLLQPEETEQDNKVEEENLNVDIL